MKYFLGYIDFKVYITKLSINKYAKNHISFEGLSSLWLHIPLKHTKEEGKRILTQNFGYRILEA